MRTLSLSIAASCVLTSAMVFDASAQVPVAGDRDRSGRVLAKVVVKMPEPGALGFPVQSLSLFVVTENGDRVAIRTDAAGVASVWLSAGNYRFVTRDPTQWNGKAYTWDLIIRVRLGMGIIALSGANATKIVALVTEPAVVKAAPKTQTSSQLPSVMGAPVAGQPRANSREFWFNIGFGFGSLGCNICVGYLGGATGGLSLGRRVGSKLLLGVGATAWTKSQAGASLSAGTARTN